MAGQVFSMVWHAPTHESTERSTDWYWALGVLALGGAGLAVFFGNLLFAAIIMLGALSIGILAAKEPRMCEIEISEKGVRIETNLYPYRSLKSFAIDEESRERPQLIVMTSSFINPELILPLGDHINPEDVRAVLRTKLEEGEHVESAFSRLADMVGL